MLYVSGFGILVTCVQFPEPKKMLTPRRNQNLGFFLSVEIWMLKKKKKNGTFAETTASSALVPLAQNTTTTRP